ncbi:ABC transporter ATP-binding protein [Paenibacillus amylolyticus]|uniref:ABC transporter ATP-binding protein n=1 Tax=Paenibacillus amylolyticus TaxID=1451 RepID=A0A5M9WVG9_PAEAM|nr:ABC transporter ATP-binding protein [Paenibacillus amylolyticus]KAA8785644.1 ABC transporter ATP-binding protein [Paenibacillus amylolyticus]MDP9702722.1 teichoic acid transport system ATP-binding protein [Paenibacillus intestini]
MNNYAVELSNVGKEFQTYANPINRLKELLFEDREYSEKFTVLKNVNLRIPRGQTIGLIGENGSGKSTLLQLICGILKPTTGVVSVEGKISALLELGAGFNPEFTGRENVYMNGAIQGFTRAEMDVRMPIIEGFAEIGEFIDKPVKTYSSGMYVRLAFASAINVNPDILIVDEALAVGDLYFQLKCIEKIKEFKESGKTIIYVSHDTYSVKNICDYVVWIKEGNIFEQGDPVQVVPHFEDYMKLKKDINSNVSNKTESTSTSEELMLKIVETNCYEYKTRNVKQQFEVNDSMTISVNYELLKSVDEIVAGVAIFGADGSSICGLNTKLDSITIKPNLGENELFIHYSDLNLFPGTYTIHVGFFEREAVGRMDYKADTGSFNIISSSYKGEGVVLLKHEWEVK